MREIRKAKYAQESIKKGLCVRIFDYVEDVPIRDLVLCARKNNFKSIGGLNMSDGREVKNILHAFIYDNDTMQEINGYYTICNKEPDFSNESYENWQIWLPVARDVFKNVNKSTVSDFHIDLIREYYLEGNKVPQISTKFHMNAADLCACLNSGLADFRRSQVAKRLKAILEIAERFATIDEFLETIVLLSPLYDDEGKRRTEFVHFFNIGNELFKKELMMKFAEIAPESISEILIQKLK